MFLHYLLYHYILNLNFVHYTFCYCLFLRSHPRSGTGPTRPTSARNIMIPSPPSTMRPSSARVRPASARSLPTGGSITRSSFKDYIVSDATKNIPSSKPMSKGFGVSETRSSQLRLGLRKQASSDWMLGETKEYLRKRPEDFKKTKSRGGCNSWNYVWIFLATMHDVFEVNLWNLGLCFLVAIIWPIRSLITWTWFYSNLAISWVMSSFADSSRSFLLNLFPAFSFNWFYLFLCFVLFFHNHFFVFSVFLHIINN